MGSDQMLSLLIHGARDLCPHRKKIFEYGGNTTCFEIETEDSRIFVDAGTGFSSANIDEDKKSLSTFYSFTSRSFAGIVV